MSRGTLGPRAVFGLPLAVGMLGLAGLVGALLTDGLWDLVCSGLVATSVLLVLWARLRRRVRRDAAPVLGQNPLPGSRREA